MNPQIDNHTSHKSRPGTGKSPRPRRPRRSIKWWAPAPPSGETPPRSRAGRPLGRNSGETPLRSRPPQARGPRSHFPDRSIKCSDTARASKSRANLCHACALTPLGNRIPVLLRQPAMCGHLSGILPGYSCKEGRRRTPIRIPL
jgi:hypothetical protein